jgi:hypothetical protein
MFSAVKNAVSVSGVVRCLWFCSVRDVHRALHRPMQAEASRAAVTIPFGRERAGIDATSDVATGFELRVKLAILRGVSR